MKSKILSAFCAVICLPGLASGAAITVNNASFEDNDATQSGQNWADGIPDRWNSQGNVAGTADPLTTDPGNGNYFLELSGAIGSTGGDGVNYLGIRPNGFVYQDLGVTFQPNTIYTVDLLASRRGGGGTVGWFGIADDTNTILGNVGATNSAAFTLQDQYLAASSLSAAEGNVATFTTGAVVPPGNVYVALGSTSGNVIYDLVSVDATPDIPDPDSDGDGMPDIYEDANGLDKEVDDSAGDLDSDTVSNLEEYLNGTDPQDADSDDDTLSDGVESNTGTYLGSTDTGTDPLNSDTDGDGLDDSVEDNSMTFVNADSPGTNPNLADTDGDGFGDKVEIDLGTDPTNGADFPPIHPVIGYWSFDDETTPTADLSANLNHGTVNGGAMFVAGHTGEPGDFAIDLDGIDDSVTTAVSLLNGLSEFTMSGWVKMDASQLGNRAGFWGQNDAIEFGMINPSQIEYWSAQGGVLQAGGVPFGPTAAWTHIVVTNSPTERKLYLDGVESGVGASGGSPTSAFFFNIGGGGIQDDTGNFFLGQIDDVAVWEIVLTARQIADLASGELTPIGPAVSPTPFQITEITVNAALGQVSLEWNSRPNREYSLFSSANFVDWIELEDSIQSEGATTQHTEPFDITGNASRYFRVQEF